MIGSSRLREPRAHEQDIPGCRRDELRLIRGINGAVTSDEHELLPRGRHPTGPTLRARAPNAERVALYRGNDRCFH